MRTPRTRGTVAVAAVALALTACAAEPSALGTHPGVLATAGCPADIRIATAGADPAELAYLLTLIDGSPALEPGVDPSGVLVADGVDSGVRLTLLTTRDESPAVTLHHERSTFLAVLDAAEVLADRDESPVLGVFAPFARSAGSAVDDRPGVIALLPGNEPDYAECLDVLVPILQGAALRSPAARSGPVPGDGTASELADEGLFTPAYLDASLVPSDG